MKRNKKPSIPGSTKSRRFIMPRVRKKHARTVTDDAIPRITNETVTQHREEVISGAKKYVYPLQHSRHRIVIISVIILAALTIGFLSYIMLSLYKFQSTSTFTYQITKVLPLPFAKIGGTFVSYEEYLFDLRHIVHYFENQIEVDFETEQGKSQLIEEKKKIRERVINGAYAAKIAREKGISVTNEEVDRQVQLLGELNLIGTDPQVFEDVLKSFYDWDINDLKRSIKQQLLTAKVVQALDPSVQERAQKALDEINAGKDFAQAAKEVSEDEANKANGGDIGIVDDNKAVYLQEYNALKQLQPGQVSGIIVLDSGLAIVKHNGNEGEKIKASRILFKYKDIADYLNDYKAQQPATVYVKID
jgi:hypothetical protein